MSDCNFSYSCRNLHRPRSGILWGRQSSNLCEFNL